MSIRDDGPRVGTDYEKFRKHHSEINWKRKKIVNHNIPGKKNNNNIKEK